MGHDERNQRMKKRCTVWLYCILQALPAMLFANVTGVVRNDASKPVPKAFVRFVNAADSSLDVSTFTDSLGRYSLLLPGAVGVIHSREVNASPVCLEQNRPNPVSGATAITFYLPGPGAIELGIFSISGQMIDRISHNATAGRNTVIWRPASSLHGGAFVYRLRYNGLVEEKTMIVSRGSSLGAPGVRGTGNAGPSAMPNSLTKNSAVAASGYNIFIYGRGVYPYKSGAVPLTDGSTRDFSLKYVDLWDSSRVILRDSLKNCRSLFLKNKAGRVVFLGGSVTNMGGWRDSITTYLRLRFPQATLDIVNQGVPSVGSNMHAFRLQNDILSKGKVDLMLVDMAGNDTINNIRDNINRTARLRTTEGIIRQCMAANPNMDLVLIHIAYDAFYAPVQAYDSIPFLDSYERPAWHYGVSTINLAQYVAERYTWTEFGGDVHPKAFGMGIYSRVIRSLFNAAWKDSLPAGTQVTPHFTPLGMVDSLCYRFGHYDSLKTAQLVSGWTYVASWHPSGTAGTRDGFVNVPALEATTAGATLTFGFTGTAIGVVSPEGPDVGIINYHIDNAISGTLDQYTPWSSGLHIPWIWMFATNLSNTHHTLTCTMANTKNSASTGYASRIMQFAVNGQ
jgi:hypothetical protein